MAVAMRNLENKRNEVRPALILTVIAILSIVIFPGAIAGKPRLQSAGIMLAALVVAFDWYFLLKDRSYEKSWRFTITLATGIYITASVPTFLFELYQVKWIGQHHVISLYVRPWVYGGYSLVLGTVIGAMCGRGKVRVAGLVATTILAIIRLSMGTWVY